MKKSKKFLGLFLALTMFFSCLFFTGCSDITQADTYHLTQMTYVEDNQTVQVNLNLLSNWLLGYSMKLVLHDDGRAELKKTVDNVESITRGSWSKRENGDIELLFEDKLTIAKQNGMTLTIESEDSLMIFTKYFFDI